MAGGSTRTRVLGAGLRWAAPHAWFLEDEVAGLAQHVGPGAVCLDVGAEYGLYTWTLASLVGEAGAVHAVEPQPGLAAFLRTTRRVLGAHRVTVHETALGADGGIAVLGEQSAGGLDEGPPRRRRAVRLCPALHGHRLTSIQSVRKLQTLCS